MEHAWIVEHATPHGPLYASESGACNHVDHAKRFETKEAAGAYIRERGFKLKWEVTEHAWI